MELRYSFFDWDDNILHLDTKITLEYYDGVEWTPVNLSTTAYALNRGNTNYRIPQLNGTPDYDRAYENFRDIDGKTNTFFDDCVYALKAKSFAPSFQAFKKCILNGHHVYIVTARGHEPRTIQKVVEYFVYHYLTDAEREIMKQNIEQFKSIYNTNNNTEKCVIREYLDNCEYIGVTSRSFVNSIKPYELSSPYDLSKPEDGKDIVVNRFIQKCVKNRIKGGDKINSISIGFSDDDVRNLFKITETFKIAKEVYPDVKFVIYDTSRNVDGSTNYIKNVL
jgi:hypothetical protein